MERELLQWLRATLPSSSNAPFGIDDDASLLLSSNNNIVVTTDSLIEGVHFDDSMTREQIGRKALAVNLSDLASMAAKPMAAYVNLCIPRSARLEEVQQLYSGMLPLATSMGVIIAGGDTNTGSEQWIISITAIGLEPASGCWRQDQARASDQIVVTGSFGGSLADKHFTFEPKCKLASYLAENYEIHAATDVSDGLSLDLAKIANRSGLGLTIDAKQIPISVAATRSSSSTNDALDKALSDGEDFELILAMSSEQLEQILADKNVTDDLTVIGEFTSDPQLRIQDLDGRIRELEPRGYLH